MEVVIFGVFVSIPVNLIRLRLVACLLASVLLSSTADAQFMRYGQPVTSGGYVQSAGDWYGGYVQPAGYTAVPNPSAAPVYSLAQAPIGAMDPYATNQWTQPITGLRPFGGYFADRFSGTGWNPNFIPQMPGYAGDQAGRLWLRTDYLHWWTEGMETPPLVTTSTAGTAQNVAAVLGESNTSVLYGGQQINGDSVNGLRFRGGFWLTPTRAYGIESEFFALENQDDRYVGFSDGTNIIGRPFFDIANGRETAQLVSFPAVAAGSVTVESDTDLKSFMLAGRAALNPPRASPVCQYNACDDRIDWLVGYRYVDLDEQLRFTENIDSLLVGAPGSIAIGESFRTQNEFNGLQLGVAYQANFNRMWLESLLRVAVGYNTQRVTIAGNTALTEAGITDQFNGGLLAQRTNIGTHERDQFSMIPEIGLTLGYRIRSWLHATAGYTVMYYPSVVRPGDQIDRDVNPNLLAPEVVPFTGALRPGFRFIESDYVAHGLSLGAEFRF